MISKEKATLLLQNYVKNKDLISTYNTHIPKTQIKEHSYCWEIPWCSQKYYETKNFDYQMVGAGPYLVDKENGKIYLTGSRSIDWIKSFEDYKENKPNSKKWGELKNHFLDVKILLSNKKKLFAYSKKCTYEKIDLCIEEEVSKIISISNFKENILVFRQKKNEVETTLLFCSENKNPIIPNSDVQILSFQPIKYVSFQYKKENFPIAFPGPIGILKEWLRLNLEFKGTDNYWYEVLQQNLNRPFSEWIIKINMEIEVK